MIREYEKLFLEGGGATIGQEGYSTTSHATETDDSVSLTKSIVQYAKRATMAKSKAAELESCLVPYKHQTSVYQHQPPQQIT